VELGLPDAYRLHWLDSLSWQSDAVVKGSLDESQIRENPIDLALYFE
jgi:hypothetical protein